MKYINHLTCAFQDEKMQAAVAAGGLKAYAAYWIILETIGAQIRPESVSTGLTLTWPQWGAKLLVDVRTARKLASILQTAALIMLQDSGKSARIEIPNILKYCDEYSRKIGIKSGQTPDITPDKLRTLSGAPALQTLKTLDQDQKHTPKISSPKNGSGRVLVEYSEEFKEFWAAYPLKIRKLIAFKKYQSVRKHPEHTRARVNDSAVEYAAICKREKREDRYILHPATFLEKDRWKDYCFAQDGPQEETKQVPDAMTHRTS